MPWIRETEKFWEASLTGDLVCGYCSRLHPVSPGSSLSAGSLKCSFCKKVADLKKEILEMADKRVRSAYPSGRPSEDGPKWKGD